MVDSINTRVSGSRDMDLRKWIKQDGFSTEFLLQCADDADETTSSLVSEANDSEDRSAGVSPVPSQENTTGAQPTNQTLEQPSTSTPIPPVEQERDCLSGVLDEVRQISITVDDLKAEIEAINSKILLREMEHKDLKVI